LVEKFSSSNSSSRETRRLTGGEELELELILSQMAQKPMLRGEVARAGDLGGHLIDL